MQKLKLHSDKIANIGAGAFYNCPADIYCDKLDSETALNISKQELPFFNEQGDLTLELHYKDGELVLDNCTGTGKTLNIVCDSLKVISANAFQGNKSLENVSIPASVTRIGDNAFRGCSRLGTFSITDAENSKLLEIGDYAFNGCSQLKAITLPDKLLKIGMHAFSECDAMDEITLPDSVSAIGANAFHNGPEKVYCSSYTAAPAFLVSAMPHTFWYKEGTNPELELRWENDNSDLALYSFHGDPDVEVPDYVTEIRADAFEDMKDTIQSVKIPASVTVLPTGLFDGYPKLSEIEFVENTSVQNEAIRNCADLESVKGLTDLTVIDTNFDNCPKLRLATPYEKLRNELRLATQPDFAKKAVLLTPPISSDAAIL